MTSAAVRAGEVKRAGDEVAVPASSVPISAERRTREASSAGVRAPEISSLASRPKRFKTLVRESVQHHDGRLEDRSEHSCGRAKRLPKGNARAIAMFLGTSSPKSMDKRWRRPWPGRGTRTARRLRQSGPAAKRARASSWPTEGSMTKPVSRVVKVMPNWQLESWVERDFRHLSNAAAASSPLSTALWTVAWSSATRENSTATKKPVPRIRSKAGQKEKPLHQSPPMERTAGAGHQED